jgi:hypothetical protein
MDRPTWPQMRATHKMYLKLIRAKIHRQRLIVARICGISRSDNGSAPICCLKFLAAIQGKTNNAANSLNNMDIIFSSR